MVSCWGRYPYFNNEPIQIIDVILMNSAYGLSGSFGSRVRSKSIGHNTYTGRRSNLLSKTKPIHEPVKQYELNFSYSISHFSWLPQAASRVLINFLSQNFSYASMTIGPVNNGFIPNKLRIHLHICNHSMITFF